MEDILNNPDICYYHRVCKYNYWNIMKDGGAEFYVKAYEGKGCPFRGGMNSCGETNCLPWYWRKKGHTKMSISQLFIIQKTTSSVNQCLSTLS